MNLRLFPIAIATSSVLVAATGLLGWRYFGNEIIVDNQSGLDLAGLEIRLAHADYLFRDLKPGQQQRQRFSIESDDHFRVRGHLANGIRFHGEFGYITNGMYGERVQVIVMPDGYLEFQQSSGY